MYTSQLKRYSFTRHSRAPMQWWFNTSHCELQSVTLAHTGVIRLNQAARCKSCYRSLCALHRDHSSQSRTRIHRRAQQSANMQETTAKSNSLTQPQLMFRLTGPFFRGHQQFLQVPHASLRKPLRITNWRKILTNWMHFLVITNAQCQTTEGKVKVKFIILHKDSIGGLLISLC